MSWPNFVQNGKISIRFLIPIAIASSCFVFFPSDWKVKLGIQTLSISYGQYFGIAFILAVVLILTDIVSNVYQYFSSKIRRSKIAGFVKEHIENLGWYEKALVREFYITGHDTIFLPINNPTVNGLVSKRILMQISSTGSIVRYEPCFSFCLTELAKKHITNINIELPNNPTLDQLSLISQNRFTW